MKKCQKRGLQRPTQPFLTIFDHFGDSLGKYPQNPQKTRFFTIFDNFDISGEGAPPPKTDPKVHGFGGLKKQLKT